MESCNRGNMLYIYMFLVVCILTISSVFIFENQLITAAVLLGGIFIIGIISSIIYVLQHGKDEGK